MHLVQVSGQDSMIPNAESSAHRASKVLEGNMRPVAGLSVEGLGGKRFKE